jgi:tetratricopeptide (TPR) repeat protein
LDTVLCSCGSGLRRVRCCGMDAGALPEPANVTVLDPQGQEATKFFSEKKYSEAEALALKLLDLAPNQRLALRVLFEIRKAQNRGPAAEALGRRLADLPGPASLKAAANSQLAQYIISQGRYADAEGPAAKALMGAPKDATAHHVMGVVLTETGRVRAGERHYRRALALLGREDGMVLANTAWNLKLQGRLGEAASIYEKALALRADNKRGIGGYAQVEMARGNTGKAFALLDDGLTRWPNERTLRLLRALADLATGNADSVLERLGGPPDNLMAAELCARGQALGRLGRMSEAVTCYATAKKMQRERNGQSYQPEPFIAKAKAYKAYFTSDRVMPLPRASTTSSPVPVFLLGFPGSGTSLLEQLLSLVPGFASGDDFSPVADLVDLVPRLSGSGAGYPEALDELLVADGQDLPGQLRARYEDSYAKFTLARPDLRFITDRAPANAWHLGAIKLLFPDAPIIHVIRHPLDIMLSILSQDRKLEANCGTSMLAAARHYALTMDMVKHYRGQLTLRYLPVRYEDLVRDTGATLRRVLDFIGTDPAALPQEAVLYANNAKPMDPIPAHFAMRESLHDRSVYRYQKYLQAVPNLFNEVREVLEPWIAGLGYGRVGL